MRNGRGPPGAAAASILLCVSPVAAQTEDGGPVIVSPRPPLELIHLYDVDLTVELQWRAFVTERDPTGAPSQRDVENELREILELRTTGFMGHPGLLALDLGGKVWFQQDWLDPAAPATDEFINQLLFDWDLSGFFIRDSDLPFTIYSRQNTSTIDQQFGGSLENTFQETGGRFNFRHQVFPTNLQVFYRTIRQTNTAQAQDFNIDQLTVQADGRIEMSQTQRMAWDVKWDDVNESGNLFVPQSFDRLEANATHTLEFGEQQRNVLRTQLRAFNESGGRDFTQIRLDPRLRLYHTEDLNSWYDYSFEWDQRPTQEQIINRGTANVQYQVYDSLSMIGTAGFNLLDIPTQDFTSNEIFGRGDLQYTKQVPGGLLNANLNGFVSWLDQSEQGGAIQITDQLFTFNAANMFTINERNVLASSIVITDLTGIITYTLNVDYTVATFPDQTEVNRVLGGNIAPGQSVLVDYVIGPQPGGSIITTGVGLGVRYTFEEGILLGLSMYSNVLFQDESATDPDDENDFTDLRYGVEYTIWKLFFKAEREHRWSNFSPFEATRLEGRYTESLGRGGSLVLSALFQDLTRSNEGIRTTTASFSGQWSQSFGEHLRLAMLIQYQWSNDTISLQSQALEGQFDLSWRYRQTEIYAQVRGNITDSTTADDTSFQRFIVGLRREF